MCIAAENVVQSLLILAFISNSRVLCHIDNIHSVGLKARENVTVLYLYVSVWDMPSILCCTKTYHPDVRCAYGAQEKPKKLAQAF